PSKSPPVLAELVDLPARLYKAGRTVASTVLGRLRGRLHSRAERRLLARANAIVVVSPVEQARAQRWAPDRPVHLMPSGIDLDYFQRRAEPPDATTLLFAGAMDYWPNVDAVEHFCRDILPRVRSQVPTVRLVIAGRNPTARVRVLANDHVEIVGTVAD